MYAGETAWGKMDASKFIYKIQLYEKYLYGTDKKSNYFITLLTNG